jgi:hypothetical protein
MEASAVAPKIDSPGSSFTVLRWIFPAPAAASAEEPITDEERSVYRRWEAGSLLPFFLLVLILGHAWYLGLTRAATLFRHEAPGTRFLVQPAWYVWLIPALALGLITSAIPLDWLYRALLRDSYRRYERYCIQRVGFDGRRLFVLLAAITAIVDRLRAFARVVGGCLLWVWLVAVVLREQHSRKQGRATHCIYKVLRIF